MSPTGHLSAEKRKQLCEVLGVSPDGTRSELKRVFRKLAFQLHPDKNSHDPSASQKFRLANEAYDLLKPTFTDDKPPVPPPKVHSPNADDEETKETGMRRAGSASWLGDGDSSCTSSGSGRVQGPVGRSARQANRAKSFSTLMASIGMDVGSDSSDGTDGSSSSSPAAFESIHGVGSIEPSKKLAKTNSGTCAQSLQPDPADLEAPSDATSSDLGPRNDKKARESANDKGKDVKGKRGSGTGLSAVKSEIKTEVKKFFTGAGSRTKSKATDGKDSKKDTSPHWTFGRMLSCGFLVVLWLAFAAAIIWMWCELIVAADDTSNEVSSELVGTLASPTEGAVSNKKMVLTLNTPRPTSVVAGTSAVSAVGRGVPSASGQGPRRMLRELGENRQ